MNQFDRYKRDYEIAEATAALAEFKIGFRRSRNNNLCQFLDDSTLTIFKKRGRYRWSVCDAEDDVHFSTHEFEDEDDAITSLARYLDIL